MKIIIVEGPDGAGKTTYCQKLLTSGTKTQYVHFGPENTVIGYTQALSSARLAGVDLLVLDRSWFSDTIYAEVIGRKPTFTQGDVEYLQGLYSSTDECVIHYLTAPYETLKERCLTRGEDFITMEQLKKIAQLYNVFAAPVPYFRVVDHKGVPQYTPVTIPVRCLHTGDSNGCA